jgi:hypothetical protein
MNAYPILDTPRSSKSQFRIPDGPEGVLDTHDGKHYHGAFDWFAPAEHKVMSARTGRVLESRSGDSSGQVFGGTLKVQMTDSPHCVFTYRHCIPAHNVGAIVKAGELAALVHPWTDGPTHIHLEVWKDLHGGYIMDNMIDPVTLNWTRNAEGRPTPPDSNTLRLVLGKSHYAGWQSCTGPMLWIAKYGLKGGPKEDPIELAWRGRLWTGAEDVTNVIRNLVRRYL